MSLLQQIVHQGSVESFTDLQAKGLPIPDLDDFLPQLQRPPARSVVIARGIARVEGFDEEIGYHRAGVGRGPGDPRREARPHHGYARQRGSGHVHRPPAQMGLVEVRRCGWLEVGVGGKQGRTARRARRRHQEGAASDAATAQAQRTTKRIGGAEGDGRAPRRSHCVDPDARGKEAPCPEAAEVLDQLLHRHDLFQGAPEPPRIELQQGQCVARRPRIQRSPPGLDGSGRLDLARGNPRDPRVHPGGIGLEQDTDARGQTPGVGFGVTSESQDPGAAIGGDTALPQDLRAPPSCHSAQPHHLREAILSVNEAEAEIGIALARGLDVRYSAKIAEYPQRLLEVCYLQAALNGGIGRPDRPPRTQDVVADDQHRAEAAKNRSAGQPAGLPTRCAASVHLPPPDLPTAGA